MLDLLDKTGVANLVHELYTIVPPIMYKNSATEEAPGNPTVGVSEGSVYNSLNNIAAADSLTKIEDTDLSVALLLGSMVMYFFFLLHERYYAQQYININN